MANKIVWVFGPSASGKETFIRHVKENSPEELLLRLGWGNKNIIVCHESIDWVVEDDNDGNEERRKGLPNLIKGYSRDNEESIILIKGQDLDLEFESPSKARVLLPSDGHEIIYLHLDFDLLYKRYITKKWWNETMTRDVCRQWASEQIDLLKQLQGKGFNIIALDSSNNLYSTTTFPGVEVNLYE